MANYRRTGQNSDETDLQKRINQQRSTPAAGGAVGRQTPMPSPVPAAGYTPASADRGKEQTAQANPPYPTIPSGSYRESDAVRQAQQMLEEHMAGKPGTYQSTWQNQLNEILGKILNREEFSYDLNGDALYQQYKDQYTLQGRQAMMDTMGQAAALTGGYGNSYAQGVGQQAYQGYLQQLNDRIPELYQLALSRYQMEGDALKDQYALLAAQEEQEYGRYRDGMSDYYYDLDLLTDSYRDERDYDYGKYADERDFAYGQERDKVADEQWQAEFDEAKRQYDQAWEQEYGSGDEGDSPSSPGPWNPVDEEPYQDDNGDEPLISSQQKHDEQMAALAAKNAGNTANVRSFMNKLHPESHHDAIMRDKWGSYRQYVAYQIEHSDLTDEEKIYLISHYGIRESDTDYKNH